MTTSNNNTNEPTIDTTFWTYAHPDEGVAGSWLGPELPTVMAGQSEEEIADEVLQSISDEWAWDDELNAEAMCEYKPSHYKLYAFTPRELARDILQRIAIMAAEEAEEEGA